MYVLWFCFKFFVWGLSFGILVMFMYIFSVIVSYTIYLIVYIIYFMCLALVKSPKETSTYLLFIVWGFDSDSKGNDSFFQRFF